MTRDIAALIDWLDARIDTPFAWGRSANDCVAFACGAVEAQTKAHPLPVDRFGDWASEAEALALLSRHGGLEVMTGKVLTPIAPALAMRGDIAGIADPRLGIALMVVEGATLAGPGTRGTERLARGAMTMAWSAIRHG